VRIAKRAAMMASLSRDDRECLQEYRDARPCCVEENEMSYHIEINEYQRRLIMKALTSTEPA
jgi:hypothetical protein